MAANRNPQVKKANVDVEMTHDQVLELKHCAEDPIYFCEKYVKIQHPTRGALPFIMYDYQKQMIRMYQANRYSIALSARQTGKSITSAAYLLWFAIFQFDKTILIASNKNSNAMEMIYRIRYAYMNLPTWLKPGVLEDGWNKHNIGFDNGSRIISEATSEESGRGLAISLVFLDEFAFVKPAVQDEFWTSIAPTLSTGGACIITSTPNGDSDIFAQLWRGAEVEVNGFAHQYVPWDAPPGRGEKFKEEEIGRIGQRKWDQEYECQFLSSDALLIDTLFLANLTKELKDVKPMHTKEGVVFWDVIKPGMIYLVAVDPATGSGEDYSVITIFEFPSLIQVAEYRSNTMSTNDLYGVLKNVLNYLESMNTEVFFSVENNGVGEGIIALYEGDETPPETCEFVSEEGAKKRGMTTTSRTKMRSCVNFREMLQKRNLHIRSPILLAELKAYTRQRGSYAAQRGATDDCVAACLIIIRLVEEIAQFEQMPFEKLYAGEYEEWDNWDGFTGGYDQSGSDDVDPFIT